MSYELLQQTAAAVESYIGKVVERAMAEHAVIERLDTLETKASEPAEINRDAVLDAVTEALEGADLESNTDFDRLVDRVRDLECAPAADGSEIDLDDNETVRDLRERVETLERQMAHLLSVFASAANA